MGVGLGVGVAVGVGLGVGVGVTVGVAVAIDGAGVGVAFGADGDGVRAGGPTVPEGVTRGLGGLEGVGEPVGPMVEEADELTVGVGSGVAVRVPPRTPSAGEEEGDSPATSRWAVPGSRRGNDRA